MHIIHNDLDKVIQHFQDNQSYPNLKPYLELMSKKESYTANLCLHAVVTVLQAPDTTPYSKVSALRFAKEMMDLHESYIVDLCQKVLLGCLEQVAEFDADNKDDDRGKKYFSSDGDAQLSRLGNSFLRLTLECILVWNLWHPQDSLHNMSRYRKTYERLIAKGIQFPKLCYFKIEQVKQYYYKANSESRQQSADFATSQNFQELSEDFQINLIKLSKCKNLAEIENLVYFFQRFYQLGKEHFEYSQLYFCQKVMETFTRFRDHTLQEKEYLEEIESITQQQIEYQERSKQSFTQLLQQSSEKEKARQNNDEKSADQSQDSGTIDLYIRDEISQQSRPIRSSPNRSLKIMEVYQENQNLKKQADQQQYRIKELESKLVEYERMSELNSKLTLQSKINMDNQSRIIVKQPEIKQGLDNREVQELVTSSLLNAPKKRDETFTIQRKIIDDDDM